MPGRIWSVLPVFIGDAGGAFTAALSSCRRDAGMPGACNVFFFGSRPGCVAGAKEKKDGLRQSFGAVPGDGGRTACVRYRCFCQGYFWEACF